jgi:hypothetical protein
MPARRCLLPLLLVLAGLNATAATATPPKPSHVAVVVLENREDTEVLGNPEAPYLNHLAERGTVAANYFAIAHPSLPNYLAMLGGSTFAITRNCVDCTIAGPNLATQLSRAGISWRAYMGGMPYPCYTGAEYGGYVKRHNPFMYFPSLTSRPERCAQIVPEERLEADLDRHRLPAFAWFTPDVCHDAHDCELAAADYHLYPLLPRLINQLGPHGLLVVTFDEGSSDAGCCGVEAGGRILTILVGPDIPHGDRLSRPYDHYSLLASLEDRFGMARLRQAHGAIPLAPALFAVAG